MNPITLKPVEIHSPASIEPSYNHSRALEIVGEQRYHLKSHILSFQTWILGYFQKFRSQILEMPPTGEFLTDFQNFFDSDLYTPYTSIWGGPHRNLKIWPFFDPVLPTPAYCLDSVLVNLRRVCTARQKKQPVPYGYRMRLWILVWVCRTQHRAFSTSILLSTITCALSPHFRRSFFFPFSTNIGSICQSRFQMLFRHEVYWFRRGTEFAVIAQNENE